MSKRFQVFFVTACCLIWAYSPGLSCTCMPPPSGRTGAAIKTMRDLAKWHVNGSNRNDAVFEGLVERQELKAGPINAPKTAGSMTLQSSHRVVTIRASRVYRGPNQQRFTVLTGLGLGDCGFDFDSGKEYLVFADAIENGNYFTSICAGTSLLEPAGPALRFLRGELPAAEDLLDIQDYYKQIASKWYASVCGRVSMPDGNPLGGANVELWELRDEPFPPRTAEDPNLSKSDGSFCIKSDPGRYLLFAEKVEYNSGTRLMSFYPGVTQHAGATPIEVKVGSTIPELRFTTSRESLYTVRIKVVLADGNPLPWKSPWEHLAVGVDSPDQDPLAYHEVHGVDDGSSTFGLVPPGHYTLRRYVHPSDLAAWRPSQEAVDISGNSEFVLMLQPAK